MAPAMVVHYLTGTGWTYRASEAVTGGTGDVDVEFAAPNGTVVNAQVKAPDQLGGRANGQVVDAEYDDRLITAVRKAAGQLAPFSNATNLVVICARRDWPLSGEPAPLVTYLYGSTLGDRDGRVRLPERAQSWFFTSWWCHIGAVMILDYIRGLDPFIYGCTVLTNPFAHRCVNLAWFAGAHVCVLDESVFRWINGEPGGRGHSSLPDGTVLNAGPVP